MLLKRLKERLKAAPPQVVEARIAEHPFGIEATQVIEVVPIKNFSEVPEAGDFLRGVTNIRGHFVPLVDVGPRLFKARLEMDKNCKAIILDFDGLQAGILASSVTLSLRQTIGATVKSGADDPLNEFFQMVLVMEGLELPVLNVESLLNVSEKQMLENVKKTF